MGIIIKDTQKTATRMVRNKKMPMPTRDK